MKCTAINRASDAPSGARIPYGCGKCVACRVNRRRKWATRIMLEAMYTGNNAWITLTYDDKHLPEDHHLRPVDLQLFFKRLRKRIGPFRYFACGEYGDNYGRPHYHAVIFGYAPHCVPLGKGRYGDKNIESAWGLGGTMTVHLGDGEDLRRRASYVAAYTTKKMMDGHHGEFARMSRRPAVGSASLDSLSKSMEKLGEIPYVIRIGGRLMPLDNWIREKLSERTHLAKSRTTTSEPVTIAAQQTSARRLRAAAKRSAARSPFRGGGTFAQGAARTENPCAWRPGAKGQKKCSTPEHASDTISA